MLDTLEENTETHIEIVTLLKLNKLNKIIAEIKVKKNCIF